MSWYQCQNRSWVRVKTETCIQKVKRGDIVCLKKENIRGIKQIKCEIAWDLIENPNGKEEESDGQQNHHHA